MIKTYELDVDALVQCMAGALGAYLATIGLSFALFIYAWCHGHGCFLERLDLRYISPRIH